MNVKYSLLLFILYIYACPVFSQTDADRLIQEYRFGEAGKALRTQITKARQAGEATTLLEQKLQQAELGERMLQATERVVFLDSVVMPQEEVLNKLKLTSHAGRLCTPAAFFKNGLPRGFAGHGTMFVNDFSDRIFLSQADSTGLAKIHSSRLLGGRWSVPAPLNGLQQAGDMQAFPFAMPDGQTLYFAAQGKESLGGLDIFVTRYDADAGHFLKPAHLGFPFNSPANDYLYCIDEAAGVGYFITDRGQQPGNVCLYAFIPNSSHDIYMLNGENADTVRRAAYIASIDELGAGSEAANMARRKAKQALAADKAQAQRPVMLVIDDNHVYSDISQLRSQKAQRIASEYLNKMRELEQEENNLEMARETFAAERSEAVAESVRALEAKTEQFRAAVRRLGINMRKAEAGGDAPDNGM